MAYWVCKCQCGTVRTVAAASLRTGRSNSCGCLQREAVREIGLRINKKHGQANTLLYKVWEGMKQRCNNSSSTSYEDYGGRGIAVCEEWKSFEPFYKWAIENGYKCGLSIDRRDNDSGYCPENCRWVKEKTQCRNRRSNKRFEYSGKSLTLSEWSEKIGVNRSTLASRIYTYGWSPEKALTTL